MKIFDPILNALFCARVMRVLILPLSLLFSWQSGLAQDIYVNSSGSCADTPCYTTIQAAITNATSGDVIEVEAGTYNENLTITKSLILSGSNVGVDPNTGFRGTESRLENGTVSVNGSVTVTMDGFEVYQTNDVSDVFLLGGTSNVTIRNNIINREGVNPGVIIRAITTSAGIGVKTISNNLFTGDESGGLFSGHVTWNSGIYMNAASSTVNVSNNVFENCRTAMNIDDMNAGVSVSGNTFDNNGTHISFGGTSPSVGAYVFGANDYKAPGSAYFNLSNVDPSFRLDVSAGTLDGTAFSALPLATMFSLELRTFHRGRYGRSGRVTYVPNNLYVVNYTGVGGPIIDDINEAISYADAGDILNLEAGTYDDVILIDKPLSLLGPNASISATDGSTRMSEAILTERINIDETNDVIISGFEFFEVPTTSTWTIYIFGDSDGFSFENNRFINCDKDAIRSGISSNTANITVAGNLVQGMQEPLASGILLGGISGTSVIENNKIDLEGNGYAGIQTPSATDLVISGNEISNTTNQGLQLAGTCANVLISNNTIANTNTSGGPDKGAIRLYGTGFTGDVTITDNVLTNSYNGIAIKDGEDISGITITATENDLSGNSNNGIYNGANSGTVDATCNWWGTADPSEISNRFSGEVTAFPALASLGGACTIAPVENITQNTYYATIQDAIDNANLNDVIEVNGGTYVENVLIDVDGITLNGPNYAMPGNGSRSAEAVIEGPVRVEADDVTIAGFHINGTNVDQTPALSKRGVLVASTNARAAVTIENNIIEEWVTGISLAGGLTFPWVDGATISGNLLINNGIGSTENVNNLTITNNAFDGSGIGLGGGAVLATPMTGNDFVNGNRYIGIAAGVTADLNGLLANNTYDGAVSLNDASGTWYERAIFSNIQPAIDVANSGANLNVKADTYALSSTLVVDKPLTIEGESMAGVILDASGMTPITERVIETDADNITLRNLTIQPITDPDVNSNNNIGYTIKAGSNSVPAINTNLTLENITIDGAAERTPFDVHGIDGVVLMNLAASNTSRGNGITITGCTNVDIDGFTGTNNAWGSIAIYASRFVPSGGRGSSNVTINGASLNIDGNVFSQDDLIGFGTTTGDDLFNTNIMVTDWDYLVFNDDFRTQNDGPEYTFFADEEADATAIAEGLNLGNGGNTASAIQEVNSEVWFVTNDNLSIQAAINEAADSDVIEVAAGTYAEGLQIDKPITITGPNAAESPNTGTRGAEAILQPNLANGILATAADLTVVFEGFTVDMANTSGDYRFMQQTNQGNCTWTFEHNIFQNAFSASSGHWLFNGAGNAGLVFNLYDNYFSDNSVSNGIAVWGADPSTVDIRDNVWENNGYTAMNLNNAHGTIANNRFIETRDLSGFDSENEWFVYQSGVLLANPNFALDITNNSFESVTYGVVMYANVDGTIDITGNTFDGTLISAVRASSTQEDLSTNLDGVSINDNAFLNFVGGDPEVKQISSSRTDGQVINATCNWWGTADAVAIDGFTAPEVDWLPFNTTATGPCDGEAPVTNITQGTGHGTIQGAIDAAADGDVIEVVAGTYAEGLQIDKSLTITGPNAMESPNTGTRGAEAILQPNLANGITVTAADLTVVFAGFTIDMANTSGDYRFMQQTNQGNCTWTFEHNIFQNAFSASSGHWLFNGAGNTGLVFNLYDNYFTDNAVSNGIAVWGADPSTVDIRDNVWENNGYTAMNINNAHGTITDNTFIETRDLSGFDYENDWFVYQSGILLANPNFDLQINRNSFENITYGITMYANVDGFIDITANTFDGTLISAVRASASQEDLTTDLDDVFIYANSFLNFVGADPDVNQISSSRTDGQVIKATCNWWGTADVAIIDGFTHPDVDWSPFNQSPTDPCSGVDPDDPVCFPYPLTLDGDPIASGIYSSASTISSAGRVAATEDVTFIAGETITLRPGFTAEAGSSFTARIEACGPLIPAGMEEELPASEDQVTEKPEYILESRPESRQLAGDDRINVFPNPFRNQATITLDLSERKQVGIRLFSLTGKLVYTALESSMYPSGESRFVLQGNNLTPGIYIMAVQIGEQVHQRRLVVIR